MLWLYALGSNQAKQGWKGAYKSFTIGNPKERKEVKQVSNCFHRPHP